MSTLPRGGILDCDWPEPNRLIVRTGEKFQEFLVPRDIAVRAFPNLKGRLAITADGKLLSVTNGDKTLVLDYTTGREVPVPDTAEFRRSWQSSDPYMLTSVGAHIFIEKSVPPVERRMLVPFVVDDKESWLQIAGKNLAAYSHDGLWLVEFPSARVLWRWDAPRIISLAYNAQTEELVGSTENAILKWKLPKWP